MYRGAAGSPQLAHREGVRVSIVTSSKWSPGIPNGRRSCVLGFKANKLGPSQNAQCGAGVTLPPRRSLGCGHPCPAPGPREIHRPTQVSSPAARGVWHRVGLLCLGSPSPSSPADPPRAGGGVQCGGCPGEGSGSPGTAAGSAAGRSGLGDAAWGSQPVGHPLHHHPVHPAQSITTLPITTLPVATLPSERAHQSQAEILGVGIANSAQTPIAKHFQISGVWGPLASLRDVRGHLQLITSHPGKCRRATCKPPHTS